MIITVFAALIIFAVWLGSTYSKPIISGLKLVLIIGLVVAACYVFWLLWSFVRPRLLRQRQNMSDRWRRRHGWEFPALPDKMTKHLEHGDTPYIGDDGEIYFMKRPKIADDSREE